MGCFTYYRVLLLAVADEESFYILGLVPKIIRRCNVKKATHNTRLSRLVIVVVHTSQTEEL